MWVGRLGSLDFGWLTACSALKLQFCPQSLRAAIELVTVTLAFAVHIAYRLTRSNRHFHEGDDNECRHKYTTIHLSFEAINHKQTKTRKIKQGVRSSSIDSSLSGSFPLEASTASDTLKKFLRLLENKRKPSLPNEFNGSCNETSKHAVDA